MAFPRLLVVRTLGSGEVDVGDVQTEYRERSYFVGRSGLLPYGSLGAIGVPKEENYQSVNHEITRGTDHRAY